MIDFVEWLMKFIEGNEGDLDAAENLKIIEREKLKSLKRN
jgi:hypothetical protein